MDFKIIGFGLLLVISVARSEPPSLPQTSVKLCSGHSNDVGVYRFHNASQACHKVSERGPCGERMVFYAHPENEDAGECDCDLQLRCNRPLMYWAAEARCYLAYEQGPCETNQWLVFSGYHSHPTCQENPCASNQTEFDDEILEEFWFEKDDECYRTNSQAYCDYSNQFAVFNGFSEKIKPKCSAVQIKCSLPDTPSLVCSPGQKWLLDGNCHLSPDCHRHRRPHHHHFHNRRHHIHHRPSRNDKRHGGRKVPWGKWYNKRHDNEEPGTTDIDEQLMVSFNSDGEETMHSATRGSWGKRRIGRMPKLGRNWL